MRQLHWTRRAPEPKESLDAHRRFRRGELKERILIAPIETSARSMPNHGCYRNVTFLNWERRSLPIQVTRHKVDGTSIRFNASWDLEVRM